MKEKRSKTINKIMTVLVVLGFAIIAGMFLYSANLTEYEGTLEENVSYDIPEGYVLQESQEEDDNDKTYTREGDNTLEKINVYYYGLGESDNYPIDETVFKEGDTEVGVFREDWDHDSGNGLYFTICHGDESYLVDYVCQRTDKDKYYDSCSKEQEEEMVSFIKTFDYHRPANEDAGNAFQRLYANFGAGGIIVLALTILFFIGFPIAFGIGALISGKGKTEGEVTGEDEEKVISSKDLHEAMNRERAAKGEGSIPAINTVQGTSTSNLARRDHSWSSVPDFFIKLFRGKK
ncbi:MAG: hypothetical protein IJH05_04675 [Firmicutes bacterium]|nr:hypothetical protein [Bacillota bacterium]